MAGPATPGSLRMTAPGVSFGERPSGGPSGFRVSGDGAGPADPDAEALRLRGLGAARDRIGAWRALLDRPLTSYYLVLGITILLLVLGLVMVESTASVFDLSHGLSACRSCGWRRARRRGCSGPSPTRCSRSPRSAWRSR